MDAAQQSALFALYTMVILLLSSCGLLSWLAVKVGTLIERLERLEDRVRRPASSQPLA